MVVSRIAPTPSGYLHLGNILNFALTWSYVKQNRGILWLRIDDCDYGRVRREYIEDIFDTLKWLGFDWDQGPQNFQEYKKRYSQIYNSQKYWASLNNLPIFCCHCSRREIKERCGSLNYDGYCLDKHIQFIERSCVLRLAEQPYPILWTKENHPSYQLVSVMDDIEMGVTTIIRGEDLIDTSVIQENIFKNLGVEAPELFFHPLVYDHKDHKLSKSNLSDSIHEMREAGERAEDIYKKIGQFLNYPISRLDDLLLYNHSLIWCPSPSR